LRMPFLVARRLILPQAQHTSSIPQSFGRGAVVLYRHGQAERDYLLAATPSTFLNEVMPHRSNRD
jgi:hypothetical protein